MSSSLRDDLASLKIDRSGSRSTIPRSAPGGGAGGFRPERRSGGFGRFVMQTVLWVIPLSLVGTGGYYGWKQYQSIRARPEVATTVVQAMTSGEAEKLLSAKGYLKSRNQAIVGAKYPGRVESLFFEEGTKVKKGQVLAIIEHNSVNAQLETAAAQVLRAKAELEEAKFDLADKKRKAIRASRLAQKGTASTEEADQADAVAGMAQARLAALEAAIKYQESMLRETRERLKDMEIVAPFDGTVVHKDAEVGEIITGGGMGSGLSIGRATIATLADLGRMDVETDVSENLIGRIGIGQPAEISVSAVNDRRYQGRLRQIIPMSDRARGTIKVMVEITQPDEHLFPELVATVHFLPDKSAKTSDAGKVQLFVLKSAIFEENGHSHVWTITPGGIIKKTQVDVVVTNDELARVESGLTAGQTVVNKPEPTLLDGDLVKIAQ